ncbi:hypothetical protein RB3905 [Rhodopirellula baltica SH 1]|uniref:Uncharacterized protein n=3 Tax=Rhodopirellula baltica TaxID=265606 RepID=Q7UTG0_RHOBA|nr:hypothetical protein RB3905 [Rhodopirellula baltica SH 1]
MMETDLSDTIAVVRYAISVSPMPVFILTDSSHAHAKTL